MNGREQMVGSDTDSVRRAIEAQTSVPAARLHISDVQPGNDGITFRLDLNGVPKKKMDLYAVIAQDTASTPVQRGENSGHTLTHVSIARSIVHIGAASEGFTVYLTAAELQSTMGQKRHLIFFAQSKNTGPVLAADSIAL